MLCYRTLMSRDLLGISNLCSAACFDNGEQCSSDASHMLVVSPANRRHMKRPAPMHCKGS